MSNPTTDLITEPKSPPPQPRQPPPMRSGRSYLWSVGILILLAALVALVVTLSRSQAPATSGVEGTLRTATVTRGNFVSVIRLTGTTQAVSSFPIVAPRLAGQSGGNLTIVHLRHNGDHVKRGDLLVEFDRQNEIKSYLDNRAKYMDLVNQVAKQQTTESKASAKDETDIQTTQDQVKTAQLEMQKLELLSKIDQEITRQQLQEAQASLKELQQTFKLKRAQAAAELRILELQRDQAERDMLHAKQNEERMAIRSPIDGVVVLHSIWKSGRFAAVEEGDQVRPGMGFLDVVNPSKMEVSARVSQMDVARLRSGQDAEVRLDAYPGLVLPAKLESVGPIAVKGQFSGKVREFTAMFSIQEGDSRLMPDLSSAVDVKLAHLNDVLMVPNDSVAVENGRTYAYVKSGLGFKKEEVKVGPKSNLATMIESGLDSGEVVKREVEE